MKIFFSTSISSNVDATSGQVAPEYRKTIQHILGGLREATDAEVFCALEAEGWKTGQSAAELGVRQDLAEIDASDVIVALVHDKPSVGVQFEIGYAVAKGKRVILAAAAEEPLAYFNQGIVSMGLITAITYDDVTSLLQNLTVAINAPADEVVGLGEL